MSKFCNPLERNSLNQKQCNVCKQWKDETEFSKNRIAKEGLQAACKVCQRELVRKSKEKLNKPKYIPMWQRRNEQGQKQCTKCKQWKDETEFNKSSNSRDGFRYNV